MGAGLMAIEGEKARQDERVSAAIARESGRLRNFIRSRVSDEDSEDILQEVFDELLEATRLMKPIEQVGAWLFRVARNRIVDRFRARKTVPLDARRTAGAESPASAALEELLPAPEAGPEAAYARGVLLEELEAALDELPEEQRDAFLAHEVDGLSFKEMSEATGVGVSTLLSRKRYAVLYLRERLRRIHEEFGS